MTKNIKPREGFAPIAAILVVLAVLAIGAGAYYLTVKDSTTPEITKQPELNGNLPDTENQIESQELAPKDETSNWKTYTNTELGFEISYPSSQLKITELKVTEEEKEEEKKENTSFGFSDKGGSGVSLTRSVPTGKTSQDKCSNPDSGILEPCKTELIDVSFSFYGVNQDLNSIVNNVRNLSEPKPTKINNVEGFFIELSAGPSMMNFYFLPINSEKTLIIGRTIYSSDKALFDEVMATLKFTN